MTKYKVTFDAEYIIEADDEFSAIFDASNMLMSGDYVPDVEQIKDEPAREHNPYKHELIDETHDFFLLALGNFVSETPPLDIREWPDEKADAWVEDHLWQPFEDWSARDIWREAFDLERQFDAVKNKILENANTTKELANAEIGV